MLELLHQVPLFAWLPEEGAETLSACFDLCVEELKAGETRTTENRIGCLLRGTADFCSGETPRALHPGEVFTLDRDNGGGGLCRGLVPPGLGPPCLLPGLLVPRPAHSGDRPQFERINERGRPKRDGLLICGIG